MRPIIAAAALLALAGCASGALNAASTSVASSAATLNTSLAAAQSKLATMTSLYQIAKGIGQVAAAADPAIAPLVASATAVGDPLLAQAQAAVSDAAADTATVNALSAQLQQQATALTVTGAPVIKVVPAASAT
jgi:hypothetical protein